MNEDELEKYLSTLSGEELKDLYKKEKKAKEWLKGKLDEGQESTKWLLDKRQELLDTKKILDSQVAIVNTVIMELKKIHNEMAKWTTLSRYGKVSTFSKIVFFLLHKIGASKSSEPRKAIRMLLEKQAVIFKKLDSELRSVTEAPGIDQKKQFSQEKMSELALFLDGDDGLDFAEENPVISIVLVLYNRAELTYACLQALQAHADVPYQLIIVDNNSTDATRTLLSKLSGATVVLNDENVNFLLACNQAVDYAQGEYLLFLNNDAQIHPHALSNALDTIKKDKHIGAVGGKIILLDGTAQEGGSIVWKDGGCLGYGRGRDPMDPTINFQRDVDYCSGAFLLTHKILFEELGRFDERFVPAYYEETDYCLTLWENDYRVVYEPTSEITHFEFASSTSSDKAIELQKKNRAKFLEKHKSYLENKYAPNMKNAEQARYANVSVKRVLYIDDRVPHKFYGAGFPRSNEVVNIMSELGYAVTLIPLNFPGEDTLDKAYSDLDHRIEIMLATGRGNIVEFLSDRADFYDYVWISRPHNMQFFIEMGCEFSELFGKAKVIYDAEAIFSTRAMHKAALSGKSWSEDKYNSELQKEIQLATKADVITTVSPSETALISKILQGVPTYEITHIIDVPITPNNYNERKDLLFIGNLDHDNSPNVDSIYWFVKNVFPHVKAEIPQIKLHLVGSANSKIIKKLESESIVIHGRVDDLEALYNNARVFVAPTRYAAGVPAKVIEASAYGIPVIATQLLAEQLGFKDGCELLAVSHTDVVRYAKRTVELYSDENIWKKLRLNARNKSKQLFSREHHMELISSILER